MSKLERRSERGKLSIKDLNKWASGNSPKEVFHAVQNFWEVFDVKMPKIVTDDKSSSFNFGHPNRVYIGIESTLRKRELWEKVGHKLSIDVILKTILGEEYTHCINYAKAPENFENQDRILSSWLYEKKHRALEDYAALNVQIEGIGSLGQQEIAKNLGLDDRNEIQQKILELIFNEKNEEFRKNSPFVLPVLNKLSSSSGYAKLKKEEREAEGYFADYIHTTLSGAGQYFVASDLEKEWSGRFPELVRTTLEPEKRYAERYFEFIRIWFPNLKQFLEDYIIL